MTKLQPDILLCTFRHGDTAKDIDNDIICGQSSNMPLIEAGRQRAVDLGLTLARVGLQFDRFEISPSVRSETTARLALATAGYEPVLIEVPEIHEISQGEWEGRSRKIHDKDQKAGIKAKPWDFRAPGGGESIRDLIARDRKHRQDLENLQKEIGRPIIVAAFGHGLTISAGIGDLMGWSPAQIGGQKIPNTSVTTTLFSQGLWEVDLIAESAEKLTKYLT